MGYLPDGSGKPYGFKGAHFMKNVTWEEPEEHTYNLFLEKKVTENGLDIRSYDPEFNFIQDDTVVEGEFQDEKYWGKHLYKIKKWLEVEPIEIPDDVCVIGFRGGEYSVFPELFLTKDYWDEAIQMMKEIDPDMKFEVHTDDPVLAKQFFPDYPVIADMEINWRSVRYAKRAIIANSSFFILPRLLNGGYTIAPRYWARRNIQTWAMPCNYYPGFKYI